MSAGLANRRGAEFSAQIFSTNFQPNFQRGASQCTNFNSNNLRVVSPLVYNIYSVAQPHLTYCRQLVISRDERVGKDVADYQDGNGGAIHRHEVLVLGLVSFTHSGAAADAADSAG